MIETLRSPTLRRELGVSDVRGSSIRAAFRVLMVGLLGVLIRAVLLLVCGLLAFGVYLLVRLMG